MRGTTQEERYDVTGADHRATLSILATHYGLMASVGTNYKKVHPFHVAIDIGSGYNVIRLDVFPLDLKRCFIRSAPLPNLRDANGNPQHFQQTVTLRVPFRDALHRVSFLVGDRLSCPVVVAIQLLNQHIESISCTQGPFQFSRL